MKSRLIIVVLGVSIGLLARGLFVKSPKTTERAFTPASDLQPKDVFDRSSNIKINTPKPQEGLIEPIELPPGKILDKYVSREDLLEMAREQLELHFDQTAHDDRAVHHAHGEKICASGCAASRHPTEILTKYKFHNLIKKYANEELPKRNIGPNAAKGEVDDSKTALDELIYYGRQTRQMLSTEKIEGLDEEHLKFLTNQLRHTHALIEIRVVDERGVIRTWLPSTKVPFDRRHVFDMEEKNLQPLVTSGTVKRVGLDYLWVRL